MSEDFGKILKKVRETKKNPSFSQSDIAKRLNLKSYKQIQRYEDGMIPPLDKLIKLCDIFEYDFLSPATEGRCTILDYFDITSQENEDINYKIDKEDSMLKNPDLSPGFEQLIKAIENQTKAINAGFSLIGPVKKDSKIQEQQDTATQPTTQNSKLGSGTSYILEAGDETGKPPKEDS